MHKLIVSSLLFIACLAIARADWQYFITYQGDNCQIPVAVQLNSGNACASKRSTNEIQQTPAALNCEPLQGFDNYSISYDTYCSARDPPSLSQTASLPLKISTYTGVNCTLEPLQIHYFAESYEGVMFGINNSGEEGVIQVNTSCSTEGVLTTTLCPLGPLCTEFSATAQCTYIADFEQSVQQTGCVAFTPMSAPTTSATPISNNVPQSSGPVAAGPKPVSQTPRASNAAVISGVISVMSFATLMF